MKKCSFYTRKIKAGIKGDIVQRVDGWTDGTYNYYKNLNLWYCIVPEVGIAAATGYSRKDVVAQVFDHDIADKIAAIMDRDGEKLKEKFNSLIQEAENN